jgi:hypothetical protein
MSLERQVKEDEMDRACSTIGKECIWDIGGKPEGKRPLGRPRSRRTNNIKMDLRRGWYGLD